MGYRSEGGDAKFMYLTRRSDDSRVGQAFLRFTDENISNITAKSPFGMASYTIEKENLMPSLRTTVGINTMDITDKSDYIVTKPYKELKKVCSAAGIKIPNDKFWEACQNG